MATSATGNTMRVLHRYLGYFLVGIMAVYAVSGIVMIFRGTDFLQQKKTIVKMLSPNLKPEELGKALEMREFRVEKGGEKEREEAEEEREEREERGERGENKQGFRAEKEDGDLIYFRGGSYNKKTGKAEYTIKRLPVILEKMTHLHKAKSSEPLFFLNVFFGLSLLFFVVSAFWMFLPKTTTFKRGLIFTLAGIILTLILLFV